jgi:hypothetical protein
VQSGGAVAVFRIRMTHKSVPILLLLLGLLGGCFGHDAPSLKSPDPSLKIPAIKQAAQSHDEQAVPVLIKALDSDDPAIRFYAIEGLQRLTGQTLDYRYYDDERQRRPALARWQQWLARRQRASGVSTQPAQPAQPAPPATQSGL